MGRTALQNEINSFLEKNSLNQFLTASAMSKARTKLKADAFLAINCLLNEVYYQEKEDLKLWKGFRLLACDGSTLNLNDASKECQRFFGIHDTTQGKGKTYANARMSLFHDVLNDRILDARIDAWKIAERPMLYDHLDNTVNQNDLVILDRGYTGYNVYSAILNSNRHFLVRLRNDMLCCRDMTKSEESYTFKQKDLPDITGRLIQIELKGGEKEYLFTSLTDQELYPYEDFENLYFMRWRVEESYKALKCFLKLEDLTGTSQQTLE